MTYVTKIQSQSLGNFVRDNKFVKKYLHKGTWLSGCSTEVYPIMFWKKDLTLQIDTDENKFEELINEVKEKFDFVDYGYFEKSDGSCPSRLVFVFKYDGEWMH